MAVGYFIVDGTGGLFPIQNPDERVLFYRWFFFFVVFYGPGRWSLDVLLSNMDQLQHRPPLRLEVSLHVGIRAAFVHLDQVKVCDHSSGAPDPKIRLVQVPKSKVFGQEALLLTIRDQRD